MSQPFGFLRLPLKISLYKPILLLLMASSKVIVTIWGTSLDGRSPGIVVPSSEQKQSGRTHTVGSQGGALLGSLSISGTLRRSRLFSVARSLPFPKGAFVPSQVRDASQCWGPTETCCELLTANIFIGAIGTILLSIAEETSLDTGSVSAREVAVLAERLLGIEQGFGLPLFVLQLAIVHGVLPIAGLLVDIEVQPSRTSDCLQTGTRALDNVAAVVTLTSDQSEPLACVFVLTYLALKALLLFLFLSFDSGRALCKEITTYATCDGDFISSSVDDRSAMH